MFHIITFIYFYTHLCVYIHAYIYIYTSVDLCIYIHTALRIRSSRGLAAMLSFRQLYLRTCQANQQTATNKQTTTDKHTARNGEPTVFIFSFSSSCFLSSALRLFLLLPSISSYSYLLLSSRLIVVCFSSAALA